MKKVFRRRVNILAAILTQWLRELELNQYYQSQSLVYYHYTTPQYCSPRNSVNGVIKELFKPIKVSRIKTISVCNK